jgi:hypothetical protein
LAIKSGAATGGNKEELHGEVTVFVTLADEVVVVELLDETAIVVVVAAGEVIVVLLITAVATSKPHCQPCCLRHNAVSPAPPDRGP